MFYANKHVFFQAHKTALSAIGGFSVEQGRVLRRVRRGSVLLYTTRPAQAQGASPKTAPGMRKQEFIPAVTTL